MPVKEERGESGGLATGEKRGGGDCNWLTGKSFHWSYRGQIKSEQKWLELKRKGRFRTKQGKTTIFKAGKRGAQQKVQGGVARGGEV